MKTKVLIALCYALALCVEVYANGEQEVKKGFFPYMAFIYYPDESVVDSTGSRFLRGAVLIRPDWLVTSAVGPNNVTDDPNGFPQKTLLARVGAVTIDANFTLDEDDDEQEREVIQIVRPYNHNATQWWRTDISLMKVLIAFNMTSVVGITNRSPIPENMEKTCIILVYAKRDANWTGEKNLMQLNVELQSPSIQNCGPHFIGNTMTCAAYSDENKNAVYDSNFCQGNSGGPLICENEVVGIQTYIDNDCKLPHLYQVLSAWDKFISCGTEDKCHEEQCSNICDVINKDPPVTNDTTTSVTQKAYSMQDESHPVPQITSVVPVITIEDIEIVTTPRTTTIGPVEITTSDKPPSVNESTPTPTVSEVESTETTSRPNEKYPNERKKLEQVEIETTDRKPNVEAQQHDIKVKANSAGQSNIFNTLSLSLGFFILAYLI